MSLERNGNLDISCKQLRESEKIIDLFILCDSTYLTASKRATDSPVYEDEQGGHR